MYTFLLAVHIIACFGMILFVLLQTGRGAGLSMFGGGGDSLINTPTGSSFMKKFTAGLAATFLGETLAWYHPVAFAVIVAGILLAAPGRPHTAAAPIPQKSKNDAL